MGIVLTGGTIAPSGEASRVVVGFGALDGGGAVGLLSSGEVLSPLSHQAVLATQYPVSIWSRSPNPFAS
jgi:hypothetical protein